MILARHFRKFIRSELNDGKQRVLGYRMKCSRCGCKQGIPANNIRLGANSQEQLAKIVSRAFVNHGWTVGADFLYDLCPRCTKTPPKQEIGTLGLALLDAGVSRVQPQPKETTMTTPETTGRKATRKLDTVETFQLGRFVEKVAHSENGLCVYEDGWDDERVARDCGIKDCTVTNAANVRTALFGPIRPKPADGVPRAVVQAIDAALDERDRLIESLIKALEEKDSALEQRLFAVEIALGVKPAA